MKKFIAETKNLINCLLNNKNCYYCFEGIKMQIGYTYRKVKLKNVDNLYCKNLISDGWELISESKGLYRIINSKFKD